MVPSRVRFVVFCVAVLGSSIVSARGVAAQGRAPSLSVTGIVRDVTGLVLPGTTVELRPDGAGFARSTISAADGTFVFPGVRPGPYRLRASFPDFESFDQTLTVDANTPLSLTIVLRLSGVREQVSVVAAGIDLPAIATMQTDVNRRLIDTLPSESVSAGLSSLVTLTTPGVAADSNGGFHPLGEHAETSFSVDNQPITDQQSRTFSNQLSQNAIQWLDVMTGVPPA